MKPVDAAFWRAAGQFIGNWVGGKEVDIALIDAGSAFFKTLLQELNPPQLPPIDFSKWREQAKAAQPAPSPSPTPDPATLAREKKIAALKERALHQGTPYEEKRTAAWVAFCLENGVDPTEVPAPPAGATSPAPAKAPGPPAGATSPVPADIPGPPARATLPAPADVPGPPAGATSPALPAAPAPILASTKSKRGKKRALEVAATKPVCPGCRKPIHRGGVSVGFNPTRYHAKCAPRSGARARGSFSRSRGASAIRVRR